MPDGAFLALVHNASLLLALALVYDLATTRWWGDESRLRQVAVGVAIGGIGIALMLSSWVLEPGIIFDTRSILLGVSGLFFGTLPTVIAMAMTAALRLWQGGAATPMGVSVIVASGCIGLAWRYRRRAALADLGAKELYALGVAVHFMMLALTMTLPRGVGLRVLAGIGLPVLVIYPAATAALGLLMVNRLRRKRDADRLRESEERTRAALYGIGDAVLATDERACVTRLNRVAEALTGWREPDAIGRPVGEVLRLRTESPGAEEVDPVADVMRTGDVRAIGRGTVLVSREGVARPVLGSVAPIHAADGSISGVVVVVRDQTAERAREAAARERESVFRALFDQRAVGVAHVETPTGRFLRVNDRYAEILGYGRDELADRTFRDVTHPEDVRASSELVEDLLEGRRRECTIDKRYVRKDGTLVWVTLSVSPMWAPGETPSTHIAMVLDVTERKGAEERMADLNAELERRVARRTELLTEANRELEAFSYSVSHDLRAPLRSMDGFSQALLEDYGAQLDAAGQDFLNRIRSNCQRLARLIDDLLHLSRLTRAQMRHQPVELTALAQAVIAELRQAEPGRAVDVRIAPGLVVNGDPVLLRTALGNLLQNAWKFTGLRPDAVIEVGVALHPPSSALSPQSSVLSPPCSPVFFVRDNGVGFDMQYADKLFTPFQRLHAMTEFPGSGIGLATVQRVIRRHNGRVWFESAPGQGATFYFTTGGGA